MEHRGDEEQATAPPEAPPPMGESIAHLVSRLLFRGREGLGRAARRGRVRLELRQLVRDRDHFWMRLGKTAYHLAEAGEIDHPALRKAIARIDELDARIGALQAQADDQP